MFIASLGSKILVASGVTCNEQACTLAYNTETAAMTTGPNLLRNLCGLAVAAGEKQERKLYALSDQPDENGGQTGVSFEVLSWVRCGGLSSDKTHRWFWDIDPPPLAPFSGSEEAVAAYAVHPDETTIFLSTRDKNNRRRERTYSFDTTCREWRSHGRWPLPFLGQGYFDRELGAWIGLCRKDHRGYCLCACQVPSRSGRDEPEWTTAKEKLFQESARGRGELTRGRRIWWPVAGDRRTANPELRRWPVGTQGGQGERGATRMGPDGSEPRSGRGRARQRIPS
jgi:hypothetical protein